MNNTYQTDCKFSGFQSRVENNLLTPEQVARALTVSTNTLAVWRSSGRYKLPFVKIGGRVRYRSSDLESFIQSRLCAHTGAMGGAA